MNVDSSRSPKTHQNSTKKFTRGALTSFTARFVAMVAPIITVPLSLSSLGTTSYGAWMAALSLTSFVAFADLGLGSGLVTAVPKAIREGKTRAARELISSAYSILSFICIVLLSSMGLSLFFFDWATLVGTSSEEQPQVASIVFITITAFVVNIVCGLIVRVQQALQQVSISYLWQALGSTASIIAITVASMAGITSAAFIVIAAFTPVIVGVLNTVIFFSSAPGRAYRPSLKYFHWGRTRFLMKIGGKFLIIFLFMSGALGTDVWLVAQVIGLDEATQFSIPARVFAIIGTLATAIAAPLWPIAAQALAEGDQSWVKRTVRRLVSLMALVTVTSSLMAILLVPLGFQWWLDKQVPTSFTLLLGLALWNIVQAVISPLFMIQNAAGVLKPQIIGYGVLTIALPIKWLSLHSVPFEWLPLINTVFYLVIIWPAAIVGYKRSIKQE